MAISRAASQAQAAENALKEDALRKRAARQAVVVQSEPGAVEMVECRVLKHGDGKISMGKHVGGIGDAFYERGETFSIEKSIGDALEGRQFVEITGQPKADD